MIRLSVVAPVLNEFPWIGYSIMAAEPYVNDFVYALDEASDDGTRELLLHIKDKYLGDRLKIVHFPHFHPSDTKQYNASFNACIHAMEGDAAFFLHPDMLVTEGAALQAGPLAWYTHITSYAGDFTTQISKGRADKWKNIHAKKFGLHYAGGYGSQNEDFYHSDITGKTYKHFGVEFSKYPFQVADSGIKIDHFCELKGYRRRLEKMKLCLKTQFPTFSDERIEELANQHPRVTLEPSSEVFGTFEFTKTDRPIPEIITKYKDEFETFKKGETYGVSSHA